MTSAPSGPFTAPKRYEVDQVLVLNLEPDPENPSCEHIKVKVKRLVQGWTLSAGMIVEILQPDFLSSNSYLMSNPIAFLKLFDRRHANLYRKEQGAERWNDATEDSCIDFVESGGVEDFINRIKTDKTFLDDAEETWTDGQKEVYLANEMWTMHDTERTTYHALQEFQGQVVPRVYATVNMDSRPSNLEPSSAADKAFRVKGILLQYLDGFTLDKLVQKVHRSAWQGIVDQAIKAIHVLDCKDILNRDVRRGNFMVTPEGNGSYHVYMFDLALCCIREEDESDTEWGLRKWNHNEEGRIADVMEQDLARFNFELKLEQLQHINKYWKYGKYEVYGPDYVSDE